MQMINEHEESGYSFTSRKFWCGSCQRGFSALRMEDSNTHCPRCDNVAMEFMDQSVDIHQLNSNNTSNNTSNSTRRTQNEIPAYHRTSSSDQVEEEQPRSNPQSNQRRSQPFQRMVFGSPFGNFVYVDSGFPFAENQQSDSLVSNDFFGGLLGSLFGGASNQNSQPQANGFFQSMFNPFQGFNRFFSGYNGSNEEYERMVEEFLRNDPNKHGPAPAPEEAINKLREEEFNPNEGDKCCPICQDDFKEGEKVLKLPCKHDYHRECVTKWLTQHNSCPTCREPLKEECHSH